MEGLEIKIFEKKNNKKKQQQKKNTPVSAS